MTEQKEEEEEFHLSMFYYQTFFLEALIHSEKVSFKKTKQKKKKGVDMLVVDTAVGRGGLMVLLQPNTEEENNIKEAKTQPKRRKHQLH